LQAAEAGAQFPGSAGLTQEPVEFLLGDAEMAQGAGRPEQAAQDEAADALVADPEEAGGFLHAAGKPRWGAVQRKWCVHKGVVEGGCVPSDLLAAPRTQSWTTGQSEQTNFDQTRRKEGSAAALGSALSRDRAGALSPGLVTRRPLLGVLRDGSVHGHAALIKQVYESDPIRCRKCGSVMKIIAFIERHQTEVTCLGRVRRGRQVEKILRHCGLWDEPSARAPPAAQMAAKG